MAQFPVITAGTRLTADVLNSMLDNFIFKPADTSRASNTTMSNDPDMVCPVDANATYFIEMVILFAGIATAGFRTQWTVPSGSSFNKRIAGPGSANAAEANANTTEMRWSVVSATSAVNYTNPRNSASLQVYTIETAIAQIGATAGNITLQWAQTVSQTTGTVVAANSYIRYRQIG